MKTLRQIVDEDIALGLALLPLVMSRNLPQVQIQLLTTHLQESPGQDQCQITNSKTPGACGPARGIFQFEKAGGVAGVLNHPSTRVAAAEVCRKLGIAPTADAVYEALRTTDDQLDVAFARMLYWTDKDPLPKFGDVTKSWEYYIRNWRPGAFSNGTPAARTALRKKWSTNYATALEVLR